MIKTNNLEEIQHTVTEQDLPRILGTAVSAFAESVDGLPNESRLKNLNVLPGNVRDLTKSDIDRLAARELAAQHAARRIARIALYEGSDSPDMHREDQEDMKADKVALSVVLPEGTTVDDVIGYVRQNGKVDPEGVVLDTDNLDRIFQSNETHPSSAVEMPPAIPVNDHQEAESIARQFISGS